jgi:hypothetical protein
LAIFSPFGSRGLRATLGSTSRMERPAYKALARRAQVRNLRREWHVQKTVRSPFVGITEHIAALRLFVRRSIQASRSPSTRAAANQSQRK